MTAAVTTGRTGRVDLDLILDLVEPSARVLDVGCGDGLLLEALVDGRGCEGRGLELSQAGVNMSVARGLSVIQGDADTDLADFPDQSFDYAILSQTLQATREPRTVLRELVRIGRHAIVSLPNFGYWRVRWSLLATGRMPVTTALPQSWFDTPNIHLCTIQDFLDLALLEGLVVERAVAFDAGGRRRDIRSQRLANIFGQQAVFLLRR
ncbi:MAG: methionine biosynthesis protein MetW [Alphaproteobacteria bacterium]|nr:methionine biosynthesis protein MetW [Alphaproteobacteria bacterium]TAD90443.1 MAG: methionine biosynthesis protein MetW [Alphaproteobacteria bacterium]